MKYCFMEEKNQKASKNKIMEDIAQITQAELDKYKNMFNEKVGHYSVVFEKDENGEETFQIYKGESGVDANWSGYVILENDYSVKWKFSVLNGVFVEAVMKITDGNKDVVSNIYDFYNIWKNELVKYLVSGESGEEVGSMEGGEEIVSGGPAETSPVGEEMPLAESTGTKGRQRLINDSSDRMKRLAGLK